ncbi:MAG: hypothetical protein H8F28_22550 [Fibrella sp.]|nr:hypothetical protein [Armatimonadota bacterium]
MTENKSFFRKNYRRFALNVGVILALSLAVWATFGGFRRAGGPIPASDRERLIQSTMPVVRAIRTYEEATRHPPATLADLVPRYLPRVPQPPPALCSGGDYLYAVESKRWRIGVAVRDERDGVLTYSSTGNYPPGKPGVSVERVGDWAYYHGNPF